MKPLLSNRQEACKTYIEQVKLLVTLASTFVVAPTVFLGASNFKLELYFTIAEVLFILSVLLGYVAVGAVAGSQHKGYYNVYDPLIMWTGKLQFGFFFLGLISFMLWFTSTNLIKDTPKKEKEPSSNHIIINH